MTTKYKLVMKKRDYGFETILKKDGYNVRIDDRIQVPNEGLGKMIRTLKRTCREQSPSDIKLIKIILSN